MGLRVALLFYLPLIVPGLAEDVSFNRNLFGVELDPFIPADRTGSLPSKSYTTANVNTMLQVVSTKFSKVVVKFVHVDPGNAPYERRKTYYYGASIRARIPETVAYINRERSNLSLTVTLGIYQWFHLQTFNKEIDVALEASQIAEWIFPGTVKQLVLWESSSLLSEIERAKKLLGNIKTLHEKSSGMGLRIGIKHDYCQEYLKKSALQTDSPELWRLKKEILLQSAFIICEIIPGASISENKGATAAFDSVKLQALTLRNAIRSINRNIRVIWATRWLDLSAERIQHNITKHISGQRDYWRLVDAFATKHNYPVCMYSAIGKYGWWKLKRHDLLNNTSGYVDYLSSLLSATETTSGNNNRSLNTNAASKPQQSATTPHVREINGIEANIVRTTTPTSQSSITIRPTTILSTETSESISRTEQIPVAAKGRINDTDENDSGDDASNMFTTNHASTIPSVAANETSDSNAEEKPRVNDSQEQGELSLIWILVLTVIGAVSITALLAGTLFLIYRRRNRSRIRVLTRQEIHEFRHGISNNDYGETGNEYFVNVAAFKQPYLSRLLEIPKGKLEIMNNQLLGGGEFGCVYKALLQDEASNEKDVAVKMTKPNAGATAVKGFLSEIKILTYIGQHPNIVPILGAYTAELYKGTVYIATELCPLGSLKSSLKNCRDQAKTQDISSDPFHEMIRWSYEIACGMEFLEQKGVIHADLATRNVLLSAESIAKITDFGLSRRMYEYTNYTKSTQEPLPWRWMAYESLKAMEFSSKSDVWSYGVTLWEIFSLGAQPYPGLAWTIDFVEKLEEGLRLKQPRHATTEIFDVMEKCWILESSERPSFTELKNAMRDIQTTAIEGLYTNLGASGYPENIQITVPKFTFKA